MSKRVLIYCRSSGDDTEKDSLPNQEKECRQFAEERGYIVFDVLKEDNVRGSDYYIPQIQEAIRNAEKGLYDVLLVRDVTRFARDRRKANYLEFSLGMHHVEIEFVWEQYSKDRSGNLHKGLDYLIAQDDKERIVERLVRGKRHRVEDYQSMITSPGNTLLGYKTIKIGKRFVPEIVEDEAKIVRTIFKWYVEDKLSMGEITRRLNKNGTPTYTQLRGATRFKKGSGKWYTPYIGKILREESYCGTWHYGKRNNDIRHTPKGEKVLTIIKNDESNLIPVEIPAIVSRDIWQKAQDRLSNSRAYGKGKKPKYQYLLGRRFKCHCGLSMVSTTQGGAKYTVYLCNSKSTKNVRQGCNQKAVKSKLADEIAWEWLEEILTDKNALENRFNKYITDKEKELADLMEQTSPIKNYLEELQKRYDRLIRSYLSSDDYGQEKLTPFKIELEEEMKEYEQREKELDARLKDISYDIHLFKMLMCEPDEILYRGKHLIFEKLKTEGEKDFTFEEKQELFERFHVQAELIKKEGEVLLHLTCDLGETLRELFSNKIIYVQFAELNKFTISDCFILDFSTLDQFHAPITS